MEGEQGRNTEQSMGEIGKDSERGEGEKRMKEKG